MGMPGSSISSISLNNGVGGGLGGGLGGLHHHPRTATFDWTIVLAVTALALTLVVLMQTLTGHGTAYMSAPREVGAFLDAIDFSVAENESLDRDAARVPQLADKVRLEQLLREIQKAGDDLREDLVAMLLDEGRGRSATLRTSARLLWRSKRRQLEDRMRRLDMLRMRFLVVYMGIVASGVGVGGNGVPAATGAASEKMAAADEELRSAQPATPQRGLQRASTEGIPKKAPVRRLTTTAIGHRNESEGHHKRGWFGVVAELQRSPKMLQRHATIESAMAKAATP